MAAGRLFLFNASKKMIHLQKNGFILYL